MTVTPINTMAGELSTLALSVRDALAQAARMFNSGQVAEAGRQCESILGQYPDHAGALHIMGLVHYRQGALDQARPLLERATARCPDSAEIWSNLAACLHDLDALEAGEAAARNSLALNENAAGTWNNLGNLLRKRGAYGEAEASFRRALALQPLLEQAWNNLGTVLRSQHRLPEAEAAYQEALTLAPGYLDAWVNLGNTRIAQGNNAAAEIAFRRALALRPHHPEAHAYLGMALLVMGRLAEGWPEYEWRSHPQLRNQHAVRRPQRQKPEWQGEPLAGKTLMLWVEQGFGDTLQFCRYAEQISRQGGRVIAVVREPLRALLQTQPWIERVLGDGDLIATQDYDYWALPLSLPYRFGTTLDTIPAPIPYLCADAAKAAHWQRRLSVFGSARRVGLVWGGNPEHANDANRSLTLPQLAALAQTPDTVFFSLQKGQQAAEAAEPPPGMNLVPLGHELQDFSDSAALLKNLDLLITVDSAPAHLAGALGLPCWVLLPSVPDWRWLQAREDSPWYPTLRLFRQTAPGDWSAVVERMAAELQNETTISTRRPV